MISRPSKLLLRIAALVLADLAIVAGCNLAGTFSLLGAGLRLTSTVPSLSREAP